MQTAALHWEGNQFLFLMNKQNSDCLEGEYMITKKNRNGDLVAGQCPNEMWGGSWLGFKHGRFAFVLDSSSDPQYNATVVPRFFESTKTPHEFAADLSRTEAAYFGLTLHLVVADFNYGSMVHVSKRSVHDTTLRIDYVDQGLHTISDNGLDSYLLKDLMLRLDLEHAIHTGFQTLGGLAESLMTRRAVNINEFDGFGYVDWPHTKQIVGLQKVANTRKWEAYQWLAPSGSDVEDPPSS